MLFFIVFLKESINIVTSICPLLAFLKTSLTIQSSSTEFGSLEGSCSTSPQLPPPPQTRHRTSRTAQAEPPKSAKRPERRTSIGSALARGSETFAVRDAKLGTFGALRAQRPPLAPTTCFCRCCSTLMGCVFSNKLTYLR